MNLLSVHPFNPTCSRCCRCSYKSFRRARSGAGNKQSDRHSQPEGDIGALPRGGNMELIITDQRSYRSEDPTYGAESNSLSRRILLNSTSGGHDLCFRNPGERSSPGICCARIVAAKLRATSGHRNGVRTQCEHRTGYGHDSGEKTPGKPRKHWMESGCPPGIRTPIC